MPLQRDFRGLADHVGLYLGGKVPVDLAPTLQQTISAEDFVNAPRNFRWSGVGTAQDVVVAAPVVPDGEIHRVRWIGGSFIGDPGNGAATGFVCVPVVYHLDAYFGVSPIVKYAQPDLAAIIKAGFYFPDTGLLLEPGMTVGWQVQLINGATGGNVFGIYQAQVIKI